MSSELDQLIASQKRLYDGTEKLMRLCQDLQARLVSLGQITGRGSDQAQLLQAVKSMQEAQMSFNLQYLQLQNAMQNENRQFTMISNIMKTKHETAKNSISNVR